MVKYISILVFFPLMVNGQALPTIEKEVYVDEEGMVYWNKNEPVYIYLGTGPDKSAKTYNLKGDTTYSDPYYFDTEGPNYIRTRWAVDKKTRYAIEPKFEVLWQVMADGIPPSSSIGYGDKSILEGEEKTYLNEGAMIEIKAIDQVSGVKAIYYSLDNSEYIKYSQPIILNDEKDYTLKYFAVDNVGNMEEIKALGLAKDKTPPNSSINFDGPLYNEIVAASTKIVVEAKDNIAGVSEIYYKMDDGKFYRYSIPIALHSLSQGEHNITYYSIDRLDNKESEKSFQFYVDKSGPMITSELLGDQYFVDGKVFTSGRTRIKLTAIDNKAGIKEIKYSLNGKDYQIYDQPFFVNSASGKFNVNFYALDNVDNKSTNIAGSESVITPFIDLAGPKLSVSYIGANVTLRDTTFIGPNTKIKLTGFDPESGMRKIIYTYDSTKEEVIVYKDPFVPGGDGFTNIKVFGYDNVINQSIMDIAFVIDKSGPEIFETFSIESIGEKTILDERLNVYPSNVALFISVTDEHVSHKSIYYSVDDSVEKPYIKEIRGFSPGRDHKILIRAIDILGNEQKKTIKFSTGT